jgi:hypothetical protein
LDKNAAVYAALEERDVEKNEWWRSGGGVRSNNAFNALYQCGFVDEIDVNV